MAAVTHGFAVKQVAAFASLVPDRELAFGQLLLALAAGFFIPLHLLGTVNLLFGHPAITPAAVLLAVLVGTCATVLLLRRGGLFERLQGNNALLAPASRAVKLVILVAAIPYAAYLLDSLWSFPLGYDPIFYHINVALKWLQHGTMRVHPEWGWRYSLPGNAELPALFALALGLQSAVALGNLFAAILLATSVFLIAWRLTRENEASLLVALVAITMPIVIYQAFRLYVDLFGSAFLLAAVALLIWRDTRPQICLFLSGYAAGLAIGTKPVFWIYGAMFTVVALAVVLRQKKSRLPYAALICAGILLSSGFWFLRAAAATGSPLYPMRVSIGRLVVLPGYERTEITPTEFGIRSFRDVLTQPWVEATTDSNLPVGGDRGTGSLAAAIVVPGLLFSLLRVLRHRASTLERAILLAVMVGLFLWAVTLLRVPRFALPVSSLSCVLAAPAIQRLRARERLALVVLVFVGISVNAAYCLAEPVLRLSNRLERRDFSRATYYGYPPVVDQLPPGSRVLDHTEAHRLSFLLAGASLTNYVMPVDDLSSADFVFRDGPPDADDAALLSRGAKLVYDATPRSLYAKTARPWRVYRAH